MAISLICFAICSGLCGFALACECNPINKPFNVGLAMLGMFLSMQFCF